MDQLSSPALRRFNKKRPFLIASLIVIGLVLFTYMYDSVASHNSIALFDLPILEWMARHRSPLLTTLMQIITNLTGPVVLSIAITAGAGLWVWRKNEVWRPTILVASMGGVLVLSTLIKNLVQRHRPPIEHMISPPELDYSFPSGHTLGTAVFLLVLGYLIYSRSPRLLSLAGWVFAIIMGVSLVALSRLYLGYHWFTDISASVGLSFIILAGIVVVDTYRPKWAKRRS